MADQTGCEELGEMSSFAKVMTFGTGNGWFGAGAVIGLMGCVGAFCHLLNKKKYHLRQINIEIVFAKLLK